jgi:hypothetical protein
MTTDENKLQILKKVENGTLSIEEGADLLAILERSEKRESNAVPLAGEAIVNEQDNTTPKKVPAGWMVGWSFFIWLGVIFMGVSGYWLLSSYTRSGLGVGFWFALVFLVLSTAIVFFGWRLVAGRWMVLRVSSKKEDVTKRYFFWVPFPIHLGIWVFKNFAKYIPEEIKEKNYDQVLADLDSSLGKGEIFQIEIDGNGKTGFTIETDENKPFHIHAEFD